MNPLGRHLRGVNLWLYFELAQSASQNGLKGPLHFGIIFQPAKPSLLDEQSVRNEFLQERFPVGHGTIRLRSSFQFLVKVVQVNLPHSYGGQQSGWGRRLGATRHETEKRTDQA